jgi:hypothetical protein
VPGRIHQGALEQRPSRHQQEVLHPARLRPRPSLLPRAPRLLRAPEVAPRLHLGAAAEHLLQFLKAHAASRAGAIS